MFCRCCITSSDLPKCALACTISQVGQALSHAAVALFYQSPSRQDMTTADWLVDFLDARPVSSITHVTLAATTKIGAWTSRALTSVTVTVTFYQSV